MSEKKNSYIDNGWLAEREYRRDCLSNQLCIAISIINLSFWSTAKQRSTNANHCRTFRYRGLHIIRHPHRQMV